MKTLTITQIIVVLSDGSTMTLAQSGATVMDVFGSTAGTLAQMEAAVLAEIAKREGGQ